MKMLVFLSLYIPGDMKFIGRSANTHQLIHNETIKFI